MADALGRPSRPSQETIPAYELVSFWNYWSPIRADNERNLEGAVAIDVDDGTYRFAAYSRWDETL